MYKAKIYSAKSYRTQRMNGSLSKANTSSNNQAVIKQLSIVRQYWLKTKCILLSNKEINNKHAFIR